MRVKVTISLCSLRRMQRGGGWLPLCFGGGGGCSCLGCCPPGAAAAAVLLGAASAPEHSGCGGAPRT
jgi:hypothetical protein